MVLAQTADPTVMDTVTDVFSRADTLAHPGSLMDDLQSLSIVWAVIFLVAGILCMINGYRFYRTATVILALAIGATAGYALGQKIDVGSGAPYIVAGSLGLLLAVASFPMMRVSIAIMGSITGAWLGANVWTAIAHLLNKNDADAAAAAAQNHWVGALIGLIVCGMLAFILFKLTVVLFTSVSGSTLAVLGFLALILHIKPWQESIRSGLSAHSLIIPIVVIAAAGIGLILQESAPEPSGAKQA